MPSMTALISASDSIEVHLSGWIRLLSGEE